MKDLFSKETEMALLGAILVNPSIFDKINLTPDDFYDIKHRHIFDAMGIVDTIDPITVSNALKRNGHDSIVDANYLFSLTAQTPSSLNAEFYATDIKNLSNRRRLLTAAESVAKGAFDTSKNIDKIISGAMTDFLKITDNGNGATKISNALNNLFDEIEERYADPKDIYGLETGLIDFDKITCGLQKGEIVILSGVPGAGKSMLAAQLAIGMAKRKHPGAFYEMEMKDVSVVRRNVSAESGVKTSKMRTGRIEEEELKQIVSTIQSLSNLPIYLSDATNWTTNSLRSDLARLKEEYNIEWFVVDYMDLLRDEYGDNVADKSAFISMQLHSIAKDLNLAGLIVQSMNKVGLASVVPGKEHLSGSVKVSYDADQIILMVNGTPTDPNDLRYVTLRWDKIRESDHGMRSTILMRRAGLPAFVCVANAMS